MATKNIDFGWHTGETLVTLGYVTKHGDDTCDLYNDVMESRDFLFL